ncbi:MAG: hypothetical protein M3Q95_10765 [Bacteroidota bacterium]|nr:hypothetical protein [Bacteroidota bacterium]
MKNRTTPYYLIPFFVLIISISGCDFINPDEQAPGFIQIDSFVFDPTPTLGELGASASTNIRDVWVYLDNDFQGVYELPAKFPVLNTGPTNLILSPGILLNGIAATRSPYPFYRGNISQVVIPELGTLNINPVVSYFDSIQCSFCEDFEGSGFSLTTTSISDTLMYQTDVGDPNNFEGLCGRVILDQNDTRFEITSTTAYDLPGSGAAVYLELDYKINQTMLAGIFIVTPNLPDEQIGLINLKATSEWNKIYVQLGYTVSAYPDASGYKIFFGAVKNPDIPLAEFYLDNIKVVHF